MEPGWPEILFQAAMWPGATDEDSNRKAVQERKGIKSKVRIYDTFPIRNFDHWIEESKTHLWVVDVAAIAPRPASLANRRPRRNQASGVMPGRAWAPDGQSIVFVAAEDDTASARANVRSQLWQVAAQAASRSGLTPDGWDFGAPAFRPDGKALCFTAAGAKPVIYQLPRLGCTAWPSSARRLPSRSSNKDFDRAVSSWSFAPDSRRFISAPRMPDMNASTPCPSPEARRSWSWTRKRASTPTFRPPRAAHLPAPLPTGRAPFVRRRSCGSIVHRQS